MTRNDGDPVRPNGGAIRLRRHERGWSPRALIEAVYAAREASTGIGESISPKELAAIEERNERIPYEMLCMLADGFDCDPIDLVAVDDGDPDASESEEASAR